MRMSWKWWNAVLWLCFLDLTLAIGHATKLARFSLDSALVSLALAAFVAFVKWTIVVYAISRIVAWVQRKRAVSTSTASVSQPPPT